MLGFARVPSEIGGSIFWGIRVPPGGHMSAVRKRRPSWRIVSVVAALGMLCGAGSASAATVNRYSDDFQNSDTIECSQFNPTWAFSDQFTDTYHVDGSERLDAQGNLLSFAEHVTQTSVDTNSVTGQTLREHNRFNVRYDARTGRLSFSGAFGSAQLPRRGSVIRAGGHEVYLLSDGSVVLDKGPDQNHDEDFCRALA